MCAGKERKGKERKGKIMPASKKRIGKYVAVILALTLCALYLGVKYQFATVVASYEEVARFVERPAVQPEFVGLGREPCYDQNPQKNAYFGALHIHTAASGDAAAWGITAFPRDAYNFAKGEGLEIRLRDDKPDKEVPVIRLDRPLDFAAVTDHDYLMG